MRVNTDMKAASGTGALLWRIALALAVLAVAVFACGCSGASGLSVSSGTSTASSSSSAALSGSESAASSASSGVEDVVDEIQERLDELKSDVEQELADRESAVPTHAKLGEEVQVTDKLAVSVVSVEDGPYDYADQTPTVKVTVSMRNLTDKTVLVKPSNWDADNVAGKRVDHKLYVKDENGKRDTRSFTPTRVSPRATFTDVLYFDGDALVSVVYEPRWLVSAENQYVYFDL